MRPDAEICLCDTTARADPTHVESLFEICMTRFPAVRAWAFHAHDTYGLGLANVHAAYREGVRVYDASFGGLGRSHLARRATWRPKTWSGCSSVRLCWNVRTHARLLPRLRVAAQTTS
jgi:hypothetical protein